MNFSRLCYFSYQQYHPISPSYGKNTIKASCLQFPFPDDPILQKNIRGDIKNKQELPTLFTLCAQVNHQWKIVLLDQVSPNPKKMVLIGNHLHHFQTE